MDNFEEKMKDLDTIEEPVVIKKKGKEEIQSYTG